MFVRRVIAMLLITSACVPALVHAQDGQLSIGAVVVPTRTALRAHVDFPVPARGQRLTTDRFGGSWLLPGAMPAIADFYRDAMRQRGYRVRVDRAGDERTQLQWERDGERVELRLQPVLGTTPATRMVLSANAG